MSTRTHAVLLLTAASVFAGQFATPGRGDVRFSIDTALFRCGQNQGQMLEVYQEIPLESLARDGSGQSSFTTVVVLTGSSGDTLAVNAWRSQTEWAQGRSVVNAVFLPATPGELLLTVTVTDDLNGLVGVAQRSVEAGLPGSFSEMELARTLMTAAEGSESTLRKGSLIVFPAASNTFSVPSETRVYTYQELYDLGGTTLHRQAGILSPDGRVVFARPHDELSIPEGMNSVSLVDSLDLLPARTSGLYTLYILYTSENGDTLGLTTKPILIQTAAAEPAPVSSPETGDASAFLDQLSLLLSGNQADLYERLDEAGKSAYYSDFWRSSPVERAAFEARCLAAGRFSHLGREGWRTDRGRVLIRYGEPGEIERSPFTTSHVPYETWLYFEGTSYRFVFADLSTNGDFRQVFSSVAGEVSFPNWQDMIQTLRTFDSGGSGGAGNDW